MPHVVKRFLGKIKQMFEVLDKESVSLFVMILWYIWFNRNQLVHGSGLTPATEVGKLAADYLDLLLCFL